MKKNQWLLPMNLNFVLVHKIPEFLPRHSLWVPVCLLSVNLPGILPPCTFNLDISHFLKASCRWKLCWNDDIMRVMRKKVIFWLFHGMEAFLNTINTPTHPHSPPDLVRKLLQYTLNACCLSLCSAQPVHMCSSGS